MSMPFSVVREISTIIQQDFAYAKSAWERPITGEGLSTLAQKRDQSIRIGLILTRAVALLASVFQISKVISQGTGVKVLTALFVVLWHDIFVLANNTTKLLDRRSSQEGSSVVQVLRNLGRGILYEMTVNEQTSNPLTDGTCLPFLWNPLINKITEERQHQPLSV